MERPDRRDRRLRHQRLRAVPRLDRERVDHDRHRPRELREQASRRPHLRGSLAEEVQATADANELVGADAVGIVAAAIKTAKTTDGQKLADTIRKLQYNGIRFTAQWDAKGNLKHTPIPAVVWTKDGTALNSLTCDIFPTVRAKKKK